MKYDIILFDADNTLFDFDKSAELSFNKAAMASGLDASEGLFEDFKEINDDLWKRLETGALKRTEIYTLRFELLSKKRGVLIDAPRFNSIYKSVLSDCSILVKNAKSVIERLYKNRLRLFIVTNGDNAVQLKRLEKSGLSAYFEDIFISEEIGAPKPSAIFFDYVKSHIKGFDSRKCLLVGDSQTSDIKGANSAGIDACYYNPRHRSLENGMHVEYEIDDLDNLCQILLDRSE